MIDRKKSIFKLAKGECIAPEKIENVYVNNPLTAQIYINGNSLRSALVIAVVPDPTELKNIALKVKHRQAKQYYADQIAAMHALLN